MGWTRRQERTGQGPWTAESLAAATPVDNVRRELIDGWLYIDGQPVDDPMADVVHESGALYHASVVMELILQLAPARDLHTGRLITAPMDTLFSEGEVFQPDVFWVPGDEEYERPIPVTPSLICEVSSPSTRRHDLVRKRRVYERDAVAEYWFVDNDAQRFEVYRHAGDGYGDPTLHHPGEVLEPGPLPGVTVDVATVLGVEPTAT